MDAIVAVYADWGIGAKGTQPLVIPADRRRFRALTMGAAVIVGARWTIFPAAGRCQGAKISCSRGRTSQSRGRRWCIPRPGPSPPPRGMTAALSSAETACSGRCSPT